MMETKMRTDTAAPTWSGVVIRPYAGEAELPELVRIRNAEYAADGVRGRVTVEEIRAWWAHPSEQFDPARDVSVVELAGRPVAFTQRDWVDTTDGVREYRARGWVEPDARRRGIGTMLLERNEARLRALAATHDVERPKVFGTFTSETNAGATAMAHALGYEPVRWFTDMERSLLSDLPDAPPLTDGIEVRPATASQARQIWEADQDAFLDHWGGWDSSEASFRRWVDSPEFQPDLMVVAWDGDEVAAAVLNAIYPEENDELGLQRGWLDSVFTRRAWRRRGLARALIIRSFHLLRERGMETAALGVDADNPSGAFALYESVGFTPTERTIAWRRPMEATP
jgi:mycothiol synthase